MNGTSVFGFQPALPLWVLGAIALAGALAIYFSYRRSGLLREVPRLGWTLTILKILALALLILMLAKPQWTREERTKEKADLLVLLDYSESMNIRDAKENVTRFEAEPTTRTLSCTSRADLKNHPKTAAAKITPTANTQYPREFIALPYALKIATFVHRKPGEGNGRLGGDVSLQELGKWLDSKAKNC